MAFAFIISSGVQRGIFTAILWITRSTETTRVFSSMSEGEAWLISQGVKPASSRHPRHRRERPGPAFRVGARGQSREPASAVTLRQEGER